MFRVISRFVIGHTRGWRRRQAIDGYLRDLGRASGRIPRAAAGARCGRRSWSGATRGTASSGPPPASGWTRWSSWRRRRFEGVPASSTTSAAVAGADALHPRFTRGFLERPAARLRPRARRRRASPGSAQRPVRRERSGADFRDLAEALRRPALVPGGGGAAHPRDDPLASRRRSARCSPRGTGNRTRSPTGARRRSTPTTTSPASTRSTRCRPRSARRGSRSSCSSARSWCASTTAARCSRSIRASSAAAARPQRLPGRAQPLHAACARADPAARRRTGRSRGQLAERLFEGALPWAKRQGHKLLRLAERYSPARLDAACRRALEVDLIDVRRLERILVEALEQETTAPSQPLPPPPGRFARPGAVFALTATQTTTGASR